ncbi:MAG: hypothetical protein HYR72_13075 [Deltaproteobacteria bacterium]|nr:hypothetical protein [Deltaproteobacteria bacterium]MBI3390490.1 hypothetical protein [Deltaproteobacteria bacterium]
MRTMNDSEGTQKPVAPPRVGLAILAWVLFTAAAHAATLNVSNKGVDSGTCGVTLQPLCRSIGQAIANASPGDKIIVGPGVYGDLNGDGTFGNSPGEEVAVSSIMIDVNKPLTIVSRDGSGATVLDGGTLTQQVNIDANSVVFGKANQGFTLRNLGLQINGASVTVAGNVAPAFVVENIATMGGGPVTGVVLSGNAAIGGATAGFLDFGTGTIVKGNVARNNASDGMQFFGAGAVVTKNVVVSNGGSGVAIFNFLATPGNLGTAIFSHNAIVGNRSGVAV